MRGIDLGISLLVELLGNKPLKFLTDDGPVWFPKDKALPNLFVDMKETEIFSNYPVVALFCLLQTSQVLGEFIFRRESGSINPLQLFLGGIPTMVGPGNMK